MGQGEARNFAQTHQEASRRQGQGEEQVSWGWWKMLEPEELTGGGGRFQAQERQGEGEEACSGLT